MIDGGQIQTTSTPVTVNQSTSQAANDFCPAQLWIRVSNTISLEHDFDVASVLETDFSTAAACAESAAREVVLEQGVQMAP